MNGGKVRGSVKGRKWKTKPPKTEWLGGKRGGVWKVESGRQNPPKTEWMGGKRGGVWKVDGGYLPGLLYVLTQDLESIIWKSNFSYFSFECVPSKNKFTTSWQTKSLKVIFNSPCSCY